MVLPSNATVPIHHLGLMFGFVGGHITQDPPGAGILGTPRLCVASVWACVLRCAQEWPWCRGGAWVCPGPAGSVGSGPFAPEAQDLYAWFWIVSCQTGKRASARRQAKEMSDSASEVRKRRRGRGTDAYKTPPKSRQRKSTDKKSLSPSEAALGQ